QTIPDNGELDSTLTVPDSVAVNELTVGVNITHPQLSQLSAVLIAPDGTPVKLFGSLTGANLTNTVFDALSPTSIVGATAPYNAVLRPAFEVGSASIIAGGSGYSVNDILTILGGTFGAPAKLMVTSIDAGGSITGVSVVQAGSYGVQPINSV